MRQRISTPNGASPDDEFEPAQAGGDAGGHRSGYVAVVGKPNVGKSTLVNVLVGHKVAITSPKPQTTRRRILGIYTRPDAQVLFVDTPGIHEPKHALNEYMMREVAFALDDCDAILFVVDVSRPPDDDDRRVAERIRSVECPKLMALNKADLLDAVTGPDNVRQHHELFGDDRTVFTSGTVVRRENLDELLDRLVAVLPEGPEFYPPDQYTDQTERVLAAELIREQALRFIEQEVPHAVAVAVDEYAERPNGMIYIAATLYVERDSQKGILIGKSGQMLKRIGSESRREIERELGSKAYLELWVKVRKAWRRDEQRHRPTGDGARRLTRDDATTRRSDTDERTSFSILHHLADRDGHRGQPDRGLGKRDRRRRRGHPGRARGSQAADRSPVGQGSRSGHRHVDRLRSDRRADYRLHHRPRHDERGRDGGPGDRLIVAELRHRRDGGDDRRARERAGARGRGVRREA